MIQTVPLWSVAVLTFAIVIGSIYTGYGIFNFLRKSRPDTIIEPSATAVGALMGLLAFMLAFAFSMGANRLDARRLALLKDINAMGTLYLRTDLLPEAEALEFKGLIKEYVKLRLDIQGNPASIYDALKRAEAINGEMWELTVLYSDSNREDETAVALIEATNAVIDTYGERVFFGLQHMPLVIWIALIAMTIMSMVAMGYQMGLSGKSSHLVNVLVALTFSGALMMIADLDRYDQGFFKIPYEPMEQFYQSLE